MAEKWTMARYRKYCRETKQDFEADFPDLAEDSTAWFDMAQGILATNPALKQWLLSDRFSSIKHNLAEAFAEDLSCGV